MRVLFVCLGNICRSPTAEGVLRRKLSEAGLEARVEVDSAGTADWHVGKAADVRTRQAAQQRGYDLSALRGRQVKAADFRAFDLILAMDSSNLNDLQQLRPGDAAAELDLFLRRYQLELDEVPDPYYGGEAGFAQVLDLIEQACDALVLELKERLEPAQSQLHVGSAALKTDSGCSFTAVNSTRASCFVLPPASMQSSASSPVLALHGSSSQDVEQVPMSLQVRTQVSLKPYNSFAVEAQASHFAEAENDQQVRQALSYAHAEQLPLLLLGGGSNLLLTADVDALVLRMASRGIRVLSDDGKRVVIEAEAGEPWHPFVQWTLAQGFAGLENLSLIPGTVGAAPVQNIGAYGVELKDLFAGLTALDRRSGEQREFSLQDCAFAYRDSLFKRESGRWVILRVRFALHRSAALHLDYGPVRQRLAEQGISAPTALDVSQAICAIRSEKLPDPAVLGNAGSFFKNPLVSAELAQRLRAEYADLVAYAQADGQVKLAAGWLIERAGWKGFREGDAGVHRLQALVLVNYGAATGAQLLALAQRIQADVAQRFAVELEIEPNVL